jgi:hypothetical protein
MRLFVSLLAWFLRAAHTSRSDLVLENLALRQQLATCARTQKRPRLKPEERAFWAALSRVWQGWRSPLLLVKPATVIDWHRRGFRRYWRWRSRKPGRPRIPDEHIALIRASARTSPGGARIGSPRNWLSSWACATRPARSGATWYDDRSRGAGRPGRRSSAIMRARSSPATSSRSQRRSSPSSTFSSSWRSPPGALCSSTPLPAPGWPG